MFRLECTAGSPYFAGSSELQPTTAPVRSSPKFPAFQHFDGVRGGIYTSCLDILFSSLNRRFQFWVRFDFQSDLVQKRQPRNEIGSSIHKNNRVLIFNETLKLLSIRTFKSFQHADASSALIVSPDTQTQ